MARDGMMSLFNVNRSVTSLAGASRPMRLPTMNHFPKLNQRISRAVLDGSAGALPEMTSDVIDAAAGYSVENVKRDRVDRRASGLRQWMGRLLGARV